LHPNPSGSRYPAALSSRWRPHYWSPSACPTASRKGEEANIRAENQAPAARFRTRFFLTDGLYFFHAPSVYYPSMKSSHLFVWIIGEGLCEPRNTWKNTAKYSLTDVINNPRIEIFPHSLLVYENANGVRAVRIRNALTALSQRLLLTGIRNANLDMVWREFPENVFRPSWWSVLTSLIGGVWPHCSGEE
jgi:hypothetical protein